MSMRVFWGEIKGEPIDRSPRQRRWCTGRGTPARLYLFQVFADLQCGRATFAGGADHLFGACVAYVPGGEDTRNAGFEQMGIAGFKARRPVASVNTEVDPLNALGEAGHIVQFFRERPPFAGVTISLNAADRGGLVPEKIGAHFQTVKR
jgi:hypothetical protein